MMIDIIPMMMRTMMTMIPNTRSMTMEVNLKANLNPNPVKVEVILVLEELKWVHQSVEVILVR